MSYIVMEIGCLACGGETWVGGHYATVEEAKTVYPDAKEAPADPFDRDFSWRGQGMTVIFEVPPPGTTFKPEGSWALSLAASPTAAGRNPAQC